MSFKHINREQRTELAILLRLGFKQKEIAKKLGKHASTISRELSRNRANNLSRYHVELAEKAAKVNRKSANQRFRKLGKNNKLTKYVKNKLIKFWSPEQIAGRLKLKHKKTIICHETIYQYIYKMAPEFEKYLRCKKGKYRRRYGSKIKEKQREDARKSRIDTRPKIIEKRERIGDWEGDTIVGQEKIKRILTHVDRKSGYLLGNKLEEATADAVRTMTKIAFKPIPKRKKLTITYDNGSEFSAFDEIEEDNEMLVYFAYPYHSWERGTNENTNGLLRQFFPKRSAFASITTEKLAEIVKLINTRPRKRLNYQTPAEIFLRKNCISN